MKSQSSVSSNRAKRSAEVSKVAKRLHSKAYAYATRVDRALQLWEQMSLTYASREFAEAAKYPEATERDKLNYSEMSEGCRILASQMKSPDDFMAACDSCGHARYLHVLVVACIQCINHERNESSCKAFRPKLA